MRSCAGRGYVTPQDVKTIGMDVLRHRVAVTYEAEAEEHDARAPDRSRSSTNCRCREPAAASAMLNDPAERRSPQADPPDSRSAPAGWSTTSFAGQYHSVFKGRGMEFDEVREYVPGRRRAHDRLERHRAHRRSRTSSASSRSAS